MNDREKIVEKVKSYEGLLERELIYFASKLEKIRGHRNSLESIGELKVKYQKNKERLSSIANLSFSRNYELVVKVFDPKALPLDTKTIISSGYSLKKSSDNEFIFTPSVLTKETIEEIIKEVKEVDVKSGIVNKIKQEREKIRSLIGKTKNITEDEKRKFKTQVDNLKRKYEEKIEELKRIKINKLKS